MIKYVNINGYSNRGEIYPLTEDEIKEIEWATGKLTQVEFDEVIKGSDFETAYNDFCKITE